MISIRVRYYGPTNTRGARLVATDGRKHLRVAYNYGDDETEKLECAKEFARIFIDHPPALDPTPAQFNGDNFYHFKPKADLKKVDEIINQTLEHYSLNKNGPIYSVNREQLVTLLTRALLNR